jgi:pimeloyl-ACP methyl ester carboxylesterase
VPKLTRDGGVEIHWQQRGEGPLVVAIPHVFAYPEALDELLADLATDHRVVTYDARGTGGSTRRGPYDVATDTADLDALVTQLGGPAVVLGWGEGSHRAIVLAAERPELVAAVVVIGGGGGMVSRAEAEETDEALAGSPAVRSLFSEMLRTDYRGALRYVISTTSPQLTEDEVRQRVELGAAYCDQEAALARYSMWGEMDEVGPKSERLGERLWMLLFPTMLFPQAALERVRQRLPRAHIRVVGPHEGPLSRPDITAGIVRQATAAVDKRPEEVEGAQADKT